MCALHVLHLSWRAKSQRRLPKAELQFELGFRECLVFDWRTYDLNDQDAGAKPAFMRPAVAHLPDHHEMPQLEFDQGLLLHLVRRLNLQAGSRHVDDCDGEMSVSALVRDEFSGPRRFE